MIYILYRWTGEGSSKDDMIIMENLVPQGFVPLKQGDPKVLFKLKKKKFSCFSQLVNIAFSCFLT